MMTFPRSVMAAKVAEPSTVTPVAVVTLLPACEPVLVSPSFPQAANRSSRGATTRARSGRLMGVPPFEVVGCRRCGRVGRRGRSVGEDLREEVLGPVGRGVVEEG